MIASGGLLHLCIFIVLFFNAIAIGANCIEVDTLAEHHPCYSKKVLFTHPEDTPAEPFVKCRSG